MRDLYLQTHMHKLSVYTRTCMCVCARARVSFYIYKHAHKHVVRYTEALKKWNDTVIISIIIIITNISSSNCIVIIIRIRKKIVKPYLKESAFWSMCTCPMDFFSYFGRFFRHNLKKIRDLSMFYTFFWSLLSSLSQSCCLPSYKSKVMDAMCIYDSVSLIMISESI